MIKLTEALTNRFPQGNEWAAQALGALAGDFEPSTLVHDVAEGWMRRGAGDDAELVDTLFILTSDRLGLGQTSGGVGDPRWVPLAAIVAVDAVDDSPLPLQTIELELQGGLAMCVGWPESFSDRLVPVLHAIARGESADDAVDSMPIQLADPDTLVDDVSGLDSMSPSEWVEQPVADPGAETDVATDDVTEAAAVAEAVDPGPSAPRRVKAALDFFNTEPAAPEAPTDLPTEAPLGDPVAIEFDAAFAPVPAAPAGEPDPWTSLDASLDAEPIAPGAFDGEVTDEPEPFDPAGLDEWTEPLEPAPVTPQSMTAAGPPPWQQPGMVWPDPLRGVLYLGGHPGHPRKRKNGTMIFSPVGLEVNGSGFQNWEMSMDWAFLNGMEIQGPDEIMFGDHLKIDSTSSALVITMVDETRMFFEIRTRRPPSLRAALAPVLLMVENIRSHRANS